MYSWVRIRTRKKDPRKGRGEGSKEISGKGAEEGVSSKQGGLGVGKGREKLRRKRRVVAADKEERKERSSEAKRKRGERDRRK